MKRNSGPRIMMEDPLEPKGLNCIQKEAVFLLSIGTFLEYFDLLLYVHMAVVLNELFFPKTDPYTASLLSAFAFCSTFVFRPIGALIFGWIGDHVGRKHTVVLTTMLMACSCLVMAVLPPYAQIGIAASWAITICRIVQGISSMGEIIGAEIYLTETIQKPSLQYPAVALISFFDAFGGTAALGVATLVTALSSNIFGWRTAFLIGAFIAIIGTSARRKLRETPEFADELRRLKKLSDEGAAKLGEDPPFDKNLFDRGTINKKTALAYFLMQCASPVCFYFAYIHCGNILKQFCGLTPEQVIHQNTLASLFSLISFLAIVYLSAKIFPLKIIKLKCLVFLCVIMICPYLFIKIPNPFIVFAIQSVTLLFFFNDAPASPIIFRHFPVLRRFTAITFIYAFSRAVMYVITSFGLVYLTEKFSHWGSLIIMLPVGIGFLWGVSHFQKLENEREKNTPKGKSANDYKAARERMYKPVNVA